LLGVPTLAAPDGASAQPADPASYILRVDAAQPDAGDNELAAMSVEQLMAHFNVPGFSVAVIRDFEIHWAKGYGIRDVETGDPVDTETMFQAASISKPVAAMGSLKAVQDGLFDLDDDINDILTSWSLDGEGLTSDQPVTPRTLMSHTSGLGDAFGFPGYDPSVTPPTPVQIFDGHELSNVGPLFMERAPYEAFEYSGGGVTVMQQALADARGRPFEDILQDDVLGPIGMTRSSFAQPLSPEHDRNAARAHDGEGDSMGSKWHVYPEMAAAGLWTTPTDLARFAIEVQKSARGESNRVLNRATVREMLTPVGVGAFAVGFQLAKEGEGWYFQHGGSNWGFRGNVMAHTVKGYGFAIMTNADQGSALANEIGRRIQVAYEWDSMAAPVPRGYRPPVQRTEVEVPQELLAEYVGTYPLGDGPTLEFRIEEGRFIVEATGQGTFPVFAESDTDFFLKVAEVTFTFTRGDDGVVDGLIFQQGGQTITATKGR
jgi:CubicO group peptidase (beta-lactamase class C family)